MTTSSRYFAFFVIIAVSLPIISATDFIVGDDKGWAIGFDSEAWVQGKEFHVGDKLVFKYPEGEHNVLRVNGTGFQQCVAPNSTEPLATGNDEIALSSPGRKWYICGVGQHCEVGGMKLAITVTESPASSPSSPNPVSAASTGSPFCSAWILPIFGVLAMVMV